MPTPFMHLNMASKVASRPELPHTLTDLIKQHWGAFCLGNIAADFQHICAVKRSKTHFYSTPPEPGDHAAFERLLIKYPSLNALETLTAKQTAFVLGYGMHLTYDLVWFHNIVKIFTDGEWTDQMGRYIAHSTLLTYEDQRSLSCLPTGLGAALMCSNPAGWLPFDPADFLVKWQKLVADQLYPEAEVQTVPIFAKRMSMTAEQLAERLSDRVWLDKEVFKHAPRALLDDVLERSIVMSIGQAERYLAGTLGQ